MSVYISDSPIYFVEAVNSLLNQTKLPDEILIIADMNPPSEGVQIPRLDFGWVADLQI